MIWININSRSKIQINFQNFTTMYTLKNLICFFALSKTKLVIKQTTFKCLTFKWSSWYETTINHYAYMSTNLNSFLAIIIYRPHTHTHIHHHFNNLNFVTLTIQNAIVNVHVIISIFWVKYSTLLNSIGNEIYK